MTMQNYHDLMQEILDTGTPQFNERTGKNVLMIPGAMLKYDLRAGYPAVTTKKLFFYQVKGELCGFMRGATSAADFRALGCNIWDANANANAAWLNNLNRKGPDDLGAIYGKQWTDWEAFRFVPDDESFELEDGWTSVACNGHGTVYTRRINQLEDALDKIIHDPSNRRIIVNGWNPADFHRMALPPCHVMYQFIVDTHRKQLNLCMYQRSCDMFLGVPFNIASSALLLSIMAKLAGLTPGIFTHFLADAHIYQDHAEQVKEQLSRAHYAPPQLDLERIGQIKEDAAIKGAFARIEPEDIVLLNYNSHPAIKAPMAV